MNNLRALFLIPVFFIQISGFLMSHNSESIGSSEHSGKIHQDIKYETSSITVASSKDLQMHKKEEIRCVNNTLCCKETPLKVLVQPTIITKTTENLPLKTVPCQKKKPQRRVSVISHIRFIGTGSEELF